MEMNQEETVVEFTEDVVPESEAVSADEMQVEETAEASKDDEENDVVDANLITDRSEILKALEATIFASPKPISLIRLKNLLNAFKFDSSQLSEALEELVKTYENRGIQLVKVAGGYQFRTHPGQSDILQKLLEDKPARLGRSALEVLAIVSYKQPVTRAEIDAVRGVDSGHLLKGLIDKNLIRSMGHAETPGRPVLYGTAPYFMEIFGLNSLDDLPAIDEFDRDMKETSETGDAADPLVLASEFSPLAAEPDRGSFDAPAEDDVTHADFGLADHVSEDAQKQEELPN